MRRLLLADGVRGNLTKTLVRRLSLSEGRAPQSYALGIKELWEVGDTVAKAAAISVILLVLVAIVIVPYLIHVSRTERRS